MLKNYLIIAWRNLAKHKAFTLINVVGLSLSMSVCLLLILMIYDQYAHDDFHPNKDHISRVLTYRAGERDKLGSGYATSPLPIGEKLAAEYPFVKDYCNLNSGLKGEIRTQYRIISDQDEFAGRSLFTDPGFFRLFGFELSQGDTRSALSEPFSLILTESYADQLFPDSDVLNELVEIGEFGSFRVTGILKEPKGKSHIKFNMLASFSTLSQLKKTDKITEDYDSWNTIWMNYNYVLLEPGTNPMEVEAAINSFGKEFIELEDGEAGYEFELQAMNDIVPGKILANEIYFTLPRIALLVFGFLGLVVMITASINYTNLSVAKSLSRIKEIGVRKANGASRGQIISQFLVESILISMLSLVVAIFLYWLLLDQFNSLWIFSQIGITFQDSLYAYAFFLGFSIVIGMLCGIGPSLFISRVNVVRSLRGNGLPASSNSKSLWRHVSGKRVLMSIQFGLAIFLLISIFLIRDQANLLTSSSYGFDEEKVYFVNLQGHDPKLIASEFSQMAGVEAVALTSHHPAVGRSYGAGFQRAPEDEPITVYYFSVDDQYVNVMGLDLIAGRNFPSTVSNENEKFIILNRLATERLGFDDPGAAIGENILLEEDGERVQVVGVVEDYHWEPLMKSIQPMALRLLPDKYQFAYFRMTVQDPGSLHQRMEANWNSFDKRRLYKGGFLNQETDQFYRFIYDLGGILTLIAVLAIVITSLGFLGMVSFQLKTRMKEIGIRKVMGAGFFDLAISMTRGFLIMLVITAAIAIPGALFMNGLWINQMAVHAPLSILITLPPVLIVAMIVAVTIVTQVWVANVSNPIHALRSE